VKISFDRRKRAVTLQERGLDFERAAEVFAGRVYTVIDDRRDYEETRYISAGYLDERLVVLVWTPRGSDRHVISMRYCHAKEAKRLRAAMERSG
jgi:uncharacterized DUF497 family protein